MTNVPDSSSGGFVLPCITEGCFARVAKIAAQGQRLRLSVEGGGCSGFQYLFEMTDLLEPDDHIFKGKNAEVLIDPLSLSFLQGAVIDYKDELIGARFVVDNPNVKSSCGCGISFSI